MPKPLKRDIGCSHFIFMLARKTAVAILVATVFLIHTGCEQKQDDSTNIEPEKFEPKKLEVKSIEFYEEKLLDNSFRWYGPTSNEDRIPVLHAARALAYIGDDAVPVLLRNLADERVDLISIQDALREIGIPVHELYESIRNRDPSEVEEWWSNNARKTVKKRSEYRTRIGLPPIKGAEGE